MGTQFLGVSWFVWGLLCSAVAVIFAVIWPRGKRPGKVSVLPSLILRWFHALVWVLLAVSFSGVGRYLVGLLQPMFSPCWHCWSISFLWERYSAGER
jgi:hypothetical protein